MPETVDLYPVNVDGRIVYSAPPRLTAEAKGPWVVVLIALRALVTLVGKEPLLTLLTPSEHTGSRMARKTNSQASPQAGPRRRRNPAPVTALRQGIPAGDTNLTSRERALLPDPDWVTEDDADAIVSMRRLQRPGRTYTLDEVMHRLGYDVAR